MQRLLLPIILLALFILQGTWIHWLIPSVWQTEVYIAPNFTLIVILYIGLYVNRHTALFYGLIFGLLQDFIYFGNMLGIYSFGMGLTGYLAGIVLKRQANMIFYSLLIIGAGEFLFEMINYGLNRLFNMMNTDIQYALTHYMLPSVLFNLLFALIIYVPIRKLVDGMEMRHSEKED